MKGRNRCEKRPYSPAYRLIPVLVLSLGGLFLTLIALKRPPHAYAWPHDMIAVWSTLETDATTSIDWGDWDNDGDLDLAVGNEGQANHVYANDKGTLVLAWSSAEISRTRAVAWADWDNDGDPDLVVGNVGEPNQVYANSGGGLTPAWSSPESANTESVVWGDWDDDGDPDLAVGNMGEPNQVYTNGGGHLTLHWASMEVSNTTSVAWGDRDNDGDLDLAVGNRGQLNQVYDNDGGSLAPYWSPTEVFDTESIAWGDWNGDGYLDLAVGNREQPNQVYENDGGGAFELAWSSSEHDLTTSVAWGDWDGDGRQDDLAVGNDGQANQVYVGGENGLALNWSSPETDKTLAVAWGDWDGDGGADLAVGNEDQPNRVYRNGGGHLSPSWSSPETDWTYDVAWGDWDNDGDLDLAVGNYDQPNRLYRNDNGRLLLAWYSPDIFNTTSVAWGDWDNDGDLDLAIGNWEQSNQVYENNGGDLTLVWSSPETSPTWSVAWGDMNGDGYLDLAAANEDQPNYVYLNENGAFTSTLSLPETGFDKTYDLAWGDWNDDGTLDLAVANWEQPNQVFIGDGAVFTAAWTSPEISRTRSVAWGDWNQDGRIDLAVGNDNQRNQVYENSGGDFEVNGGWTSPEADWTYDVAWGDWDGDGDLELAVSNYSQPNRVYANFGGALSLLWSSPQTDRTRRVAWGDVDGDGDLDLAAGNDDQMNRVYSNNDERLSLHQSLPHADKTRRVAWGDLDRDGDLDLAVGNDGHPNRLYQNVDGVFTQTWTSSITNSTYSIAWGDVNGDGYLDLAVGNWEQPNQVYLNDGGVLAAAPVWESSAISRTTNVAWSDWDGDGDLDLAVGNWDQPNQIYENTGAGLAETPIWTSSEADATWSIAWGDWDGDGDPDLAVGNNLQPNRVYANGGGDLRLAWSSPEAFATYSVAWGDWDEDGDLDLADGNLGQPNQVYENGGGDFRLAWSSPEAEQTRGVAWGDWDGDGDPDLAAGNDAQPNRIYENNDGDLLLAWSSPEVDATYDVSWGDWDRDGDPDLAAGNWDQANRVYVNHTEDTPSLPNTPPRAVIDHPDGGIASGYATAGIVEGPTVPITYTLFDEEGDSVLFVKGFYSLDGGSTWQTAVPITDTLTHTLAASAAGVTHTFTWDIYASNVFGRSDNTVFRLDVYQGTSGAGPYQHPFRSAQTHPFRLRGSQIQVVSGTLPAANALALRQPAGQPGLYEPYRDNFGRPARTDPAGYLQGYGEVGIGDRLVAMLPITATDNYTLYHTSGAPTLTGLDTYTVTEGGVQTLVVSPDNPLLLFNLDLTLEWDARNDETFLTELESGIQRASELLYDVSDGQAALGEVRVHQAKENWIASDVVIYGSNSIRPRASMGGVVGEVTDDIGVSGVISAAYLPGQVRMGPGWDPFGQNEADLSQDWQRALAHELSHYLLFLPDNYLGFDADGALTSLDCQGSFMTNTYDDDYSEFLTAAQWQGDCLHTVAQYTTGRADWDTITTFYEMLEGEGDNPGPARLPLRVTAVNFVEPADPTPALPARNFDLRDADSGALLALPGAEGYLFKTRGTAVITDDTVIALGDGGGDGDRLMGRGIDAGDRLCVFANGRDPAYLGCLEEATALDTAVPLAPVPHWGPDIRVTPINSRTLAITVTQAAGDALNVQVFPAYGSPDAPDAPVPAPWAAMTPLGDGAFGHTMTLDDPAFEGFVRVWAPGGAPGKEAMTQFFLSASWGPNDRGGWGPNDRGGWGANHRSLAAPLASGDGQVTIYNRGDIFADAGTASLQALTTLPDLPIWLTPVGQGYRFISAAAVSRTIAFKYLQRDVPDGYEYALNLYYLPDGGANWERLETRLNTAENRATAPMPDNDVQGEGIYVLVVTVVLPPLQQGWNLFGYPLPETQPITTALAAIEGDYTSVYHYEAGASPPWRLYDATAAKNPKYDPLVNDLAALSLGRSYWIYATEATTLYLGVGDGPRTLLPAGALGRPPATFYGPVTATASFTPRAGMTITAVIDDNVCGRSTVQAWQGQFAYAIQVTADTGDGCGAPGREAIFMIEEETVSSQPWDNSQAWFHSLIPLQKRIYLPLTMRSGD